MKNIEQMLEREGYIKSTEVAPIQASDNCLGIVKRLAHEFGYKSPASHKDLVNQIFSIKDERLWGNQRGDVDWEAANSDAFLVVRTPDNITDCHVTFEYQRYEYNFGVNEKHGFTVDMKIPLSKLG